MDPEQYSISTINYQIIEMDLLVFILNGNRLHGFSDPLKIKGVAKDINIP